MKKHTAKHKTAPESEEPKTRLIRVAFLVTEADRREDPFRLEAYWPKDLSRHLDIWFEDVDEVLQFSVEGYGWENPEEPGDVTEKRLKAAVADDTTGRGLAEARRE